MRLKILTLNLFLPGSNKLFLSALDFLKKENADFMLLQEVYDGKAQDLPAKFRKCQEIKQLFPRFYDAYMPVFTDQRKTEGEVIDGSLILSRFPLGKSKSIFIDRGQIKAEHDAIGDFSDFPAGFLSVDTQIDDKQVKLINMHGPVNFNGVEDDKRRMKLLNLILADIKDDDYVIVGGDSNAQPATQLYSQLQNKLQDPFKNKLKTTFNLKQKDLEKFPGYAGVIVDMLMCSKKFKILNNYQPQVDISDHLPLVMEVEL